jgi:hypothetical protein
MRRVTFIFASASAAWLLVAALAQAAAYRDSVKGFQSASGEGESLSLLLNAEGDLPGLFKVSLRREGDKVTGGSWTLTVLPPDADAIADEKGRLTGGATGGTLTFKGDGSLAAADSILLTIQEGTGHYSRVKGGGATLNLSSSVDNPSQLAGTLLLNF